MIVYHHILLLSIIKNGVMVGCFVIPWFKRFYNCAPREYRKLNTQ